MPKDTGEFIISKSMNLRLPPIFGYTSFLFIPRQVRFSQSLSHMGTHWNKTKHPSEGTLPNKLMLGEKIEAAFSPAFAATRVLKSCCL